MNPATDPMFQTNEAAEFARGALRGMPVAARGRVVNRTHRVVRERAKLMQEKRRRDRSLMVPMIVCSVLLILTAFAVWTGLYQGQAVEAAATVQADVAALADTNNHSMVVILWFVPVSLAVLATIWVRRTRTDADEAL